MSQTKTCRITLETSTIQQVWDSTVNKLCQKPNFKNCINQSENVDQKWQYNKNYQSSEAETRLIEAPLRE